MKIADVLNHWRIGNLGAQCSAGVLCAAGVLALVAMLPSRAAAQVTYHGDQGGYSLSAGAAGTGYYLQYGERKMVGITGFVDADGRRKLGIEAEGKWIEFRQSADVHVETYSIGARYHYNFNRFQPYAKGLIGFGNFNFPYNLATGRYLVITGGAGVDYRISRRIQLRLADVEYQNWPQFDFGNMSSMSANVGVRFLIR